MSKLPLLTATEIAKVLRKLGFENIRQKGSHMFSGILTAEPPWFQTIPRNN